MMNLADVKDGIQVKTTTLSADTTRMLISPKHFKNRKADTTGTIIGSVPSHKDGDVWWIQHEDGTTAPYALDEFEEL